MDRDELIAYGILALLGAASVAVILWFAGVIA